MKKLRKLLLCLLPILLLAACGNKEGKLDEGECKGIISFSDLPETFALMDERMQEKVQIRVTLKNITTEKEYHSLLTKENNYRQELSLHPGIYEARVYALNAQYTGISVEASTDSLEFVPDKIALLSISLKDADAARTHYQDMQPLPEILSADKFSGKIQIHGKVISIKDIIPELKFSKEKTLQPHQKETFEDTENHVTIVVQNTTSAALFFDECEVISLTAQVSNTVLFPGGVSVGSLTKDVCHKTEGLYGEPSLIKGISLYGWGIADTYAIYQDQRSGDRITLTFAGNDEQIHSIQYEFAVFE